MNDPLEDQLRQLRPGPLSAPLRARIAAPPEMRKVVCFPWWKMAAGLAAAACVLLFAWLHPTKPRPRNVALIYVETPGGEIVDAHKIGVVTDGGQRAWELTDVERIEGGAFAMDGSGLTVRTQLIRREVVPVEIHFD